MVSEDRQRVIEANRSLRLIKNELESLLEKGVISEDAFDNIHHILPAEASLSNAPTPAQRTPAPGPVRTNTTSPAVATPATSTAEAAPTSSFENLNIASPPSYSQSTGVAAGGPPPLPGRATPAPTPTKPVIAHARALYRYAGSDARDCAFERDDRLAVHEYMNADWWMGFNLRTGREGIFPRNYVEVEYHPPPGPPPPGATATPTPPPWQAAQDEKHPGGPGGYNPGGYQPPQQPTYANPGGGYPPPPGGQANPYNANVPPMAVAEQGGGGGGGEGGGAGGKVGQQGKKFGKKLGNAAIFGAGASIGSNIVNSIF